MEPNFSNPVFAGSSLNIEAAGNVLITNKSENETQSSAPALSGTIVISAGGNVEISSKGVPASSVYGADAKYGLTVKKDKNVTITGKSSSPDVRRPGQV